MKKIFMVALVVFLSLMVFNESFAMGRQIKENVVLNSQAPDFTLYDMKGEKVSLSDFKDKNSVLLFFWFIKCPFCRREIDTLNKIYPQMQNENLKILSIDIGDSSETINRYTKEKNIAFPILQDKDTTVALRYNLVGVPTYVLIDKNGIVKFITNDFPVDYKELLAK
ncbi:MAG: TlpA disulfide reductase family protein [Candidatus Omnitrophica bacterium]|nr:TlpA disulfide reductase family protein [Candidatus Omnitrophota bacterium]HOX54116.1 TlpA disulfide reductase family protein [Candidatus Omnitrophota bacterium]